MLKRPDVSKSVVWVDALNFFSGLRLFLLVVSRPVISVHYLSKNRLGGVWLGILRRLGLCSNVTEFTPDFTSRVPGGGAAWDDLQLKVTTHAETVVDQLMGDGVLLSRLLIDVSPQRQRAYLQKKVQQEIYQPLMLLLQARQSESWKSEGRQFLVLVNLSDLAPLLQSVLHDALPDSAGLRLMGYADFKSLLLVRIVQFLIEQMRNLTQRLYENCLVRQKRNCPKTVAVQCAHGVDGRLLQTNDLWWYARTGLSPDRCLIYFNHPRFPANDEVIRSLKQQGYRYRILGSGHAATGSTIKGFPAQRFSRTIADLAWLGGLILKAPRHVAPRWQISRGLAIRRHLRRWQRLMEVENIGVVFSGEETSIDPMSLAADLTGAIRIGFHWSMLQPSNARVLPLHHVYFVWGSHARSIVTERLGGCSEVVLQSGCIFDDKDACLNFQDNALQLRDQFQSAGVKHIIGVFDRSLGRMSYYSESRHLQFYESLVTWAESNPKVGLLIKPKHPEPRVFVDAPQLASRVQALVSEGRAVLLEGSRSVIEAGLASDVVVALGYNSGGMVAALNGARTVFWDPTEPHEGPLGTWFRKIGWDNPDVVFSTLDRLIDSVHLYLDQPSSIPGLGDLSPRLNEIDPFRDGDSALRIGSFVRWFLEGLDGDLNRTGALQLAKSNYQSQWGTEDASCHTPNLADEFRKVTSAGGK